MQAREGSVTVGEMTAGQLFAVVVAAVCFAYFSLTVLRLFWRSETVKQRIWLWLIAIPLLVIPLAKAWEAITGQKII